MRLPSAPRTSGFLLAAALFESCGTAVNVVLALWLDARFHADATHIGLILCLPSAVYVSATVPMGTLGDRFGRRRLACLGAAVTGLATIALALAPSTAAMILPQLGRGLGAAMFWPALVGWLSHGVGAARLSRRLAVYNLGWSSGSTVGPFFAGLIYQHLGAVHAVLAYGLAMLLTAGWVLSLPGLRDGGPVADDDRLEPSSPALRRRAWLASWAAVFVIGSARAQFPQYATGSLHFSPTLIGQLIGLLALAQTLVFLDLGLLHPKLGRGPLLRPAQALVIGGLALLAVGGSAGAVIGLICIGMNSGVGFVTAQYHSVCGRDDPSTQGGIHEAVVGLGYVLGPVVTGFAADRLGAPAIWWTGALVVVLTAALPAATRPVRRLTPARRAA